MGFSANSLLLNWESMNTMIGCNGYSVEVEVVPINSAFTGNALFTSPNLNKTITPEAYPQQTISISNTVCPGTVYQFRARETDGTVVSNWTSVFTFTTPSVLPILNLSPVPNSFGVVCTGQPVQFNATVSQSSGPPVYSYSWQPASGLSCANCANPVASAFNANSYTCTVSNSCWTISKIVPLAIPPSLTVTAMSTVVCLGETVSLVVSGAVNYTWSPGANGANLTDAPAATTIYTVCGINAAGCTGTASIMQIVDVCMTLGPRFSMENTVSVYPNPSSGGFVITAAVSMSLDLFNELGQQIQKIAADQTPGEIRIDHLQPGIYFLVGGSGDMVIRKPIMVTE